MNNKRTGKFYRKNEAEVMKQLGLTPTKNSGSGPLEKEDGYNNTLICQLKSTDAESISIKQKDLHTLEYNAVVSHKTPVFAIQFLNTGEVWLIAKPDDFPLVCKGLEGNENGRITKETYERNLVPSCADMKEMFDAKYVTPPQKPDEVDMGDSECDSTKWPSNPNIANELREMFGAEPYKKIPKPSISSSPEAREKFFAQQQERWKKK